MGPGQRTEAESGKTSRPEPRPCPRVLEAGLGFGTGKPGAAEQSPTHYQGPWPQEVPSSQGNWSGRGARPGKMEWPRVPGLDAVAEIQGRVGGVGGVGGVSVGVGWGARRALGAPLSTD